MTTYEAYVTLGNASVAVSTVEIPLSVRSETGEVAEPIALLTLLLPVEGWPAQTQPNIRVLRGPEAGNEPNAVRDLKGLDLL